MQQQNRSRNHDRDEPPSPPRPSNVNAVSMDSLLALAKQAENKFIQATTSNKTSSNKQAKSIQVHQNQSGLQQLSRKRKPGDDDEADCEAKGAQDDGAEKKKKRRKKSKNKDNNASKVSSDEILGESQRNSSCDNAVQDDNNGENLNDYPYPVEGDDHCESPLEAYQDIKHVLDLYNQQVIRKLPGDFAIYDPYFCEGSVIERLTATGYPNVYNRKEDFYTTMRLRAIPPHDVLLTNPPYSSDHMERLLRFVANNNDSRPFCLLVPNYVYMKDYFQKIVSSSNNMFYIVPKKRYLYTTPKVSLSSEILLAG